MPPLPSKKRRKKELENNWIKSPNYKENPEPYKVVVGDTQSKLTTN